MVLHSPFSIGPRLLPCLKVGDGFLSLEHVNYDHEGRDVYQWYVDIPAGEFSAADLRSGVQGCTLQKMFCSFLFFLGAAAEAVNYEKRTGRESDNADLFPPAVMSWAAEYDDELTGLAIDIEESPEPLIEE
jgi:hypothetical protein